MGYSLAMFPDASSVVWYGTSCVCICHLMSLVSGKSKIRHQKSQCNEPPDSPVPQLPLLMPGRFHKLTARPISLGHEAGSKAEGLMIISSEFSNGLTCKGVEFSNPTNAAPCCIAVIAGVTKIGRQGVGSKGRLHETTF